MEDVFLTKVLSLINFLAPSSIYNAKKAKRRRMRRTTKKVCPELMSIWANAATIVSPSTNSKQSATSISFPKVDWRSVNKRFLQNIPAPTLQPVLGCSNDPSFYEDVRERSDYGNYRNLGSNFTKPNPFGAVSGYLTDLGVIAVPDEVFYGHVYEDGVGFVLHAEFQEKRKKKSNKRMKRRTGG